MRSLANRQYEKAVTLPPATGQGPQGCRFRAINHKERSFVMISEKLQEALNGQIAAEMWSANLYLSMAFYFDKEGFNGFANWMKKQSKEELDHAYQMADYIIKRGGIAKVGEVAVVPQEWKSPLNAFEVVYEHECDVTKLINNLMDLAVEEKDRATQNFLWSFINEQVEEEATASGIVDRIKKMGDTAIFNLDQQYGARQ